MPIDTIYNSGFSYDSKLYHRYIALAHKRHIPIRSLAAGDRVPLDPAVRIFVYGPARFNQYADINQHSLVLGLHYGEEQFLFMGDAGSAEERLLVQHYGEMFDTDFLKVAHHGSGTSASAIFLRTASPAYSAVSLGLHNRYHFPDPAAVRRLLRTGTKLYFTSISGALQFYSNGRSINREQWR
jgi:competence protein ComEC